MKKQIYRKPKQESLSDDIAKIQTQLELTRKAKAVGLSNLQDPDQFISKMTKELDDTKKALHMTKNRAIRQRKFRNKQRQLLNSLVQVQRREFILLKKEDVQDWR